MPFNVILEHEAFEEFNDEYWFHQEAARRELAMGLQTFGDAVRVVANFDEGHELLTNDGCPPACRIIIEYLPPDDTLAFAWEQGDVSLH